MKKLTIGIVVALCVLFTGCFEFLTENSLVGNWTLTGYVDYINREDTSYVRSDLYDPDVDQYNIATIISITDSLVTLSENSGESWYCDTLWTYSYSEDSLYFSDFWYSDSINIAYYFTDRNHLVWRVSEDSTYTSEIHFKKYNGILPPDTWITDIEDDEYEPDGDIENATSIRLNTKQSHTLTENDSDYYKIQAKAGKSYLIQGLGYFNMELYLFNQEGDSLAYDCRNNLRIKDLGDEVKSIILWTCEESDDVYPMVRPLSWYSWSGNSGYYQMLVTEVDTHDIEYGEPWGVYDGIRCGKGMDIFNNKMINK
ncbi:MAG: hypothetical protein KAU44_03735 [Candidatus Marinimicrobia bacterium]|nr:hypothetical protein [Candidatus Neomarinimicrobiota bacterium]